MRNFNSKKQFVMARDGGDVGLCSDRGLKLQFKPAAGVAAVMVAVSAGPAMADAGGAIDVSSAVSTLQSTTSSNMGLIGTCLFALAGIALAITWAKATFFG